MFEPSENSDDHLIAN